MEDLNQEGLVEQRPGDSFVEITKKAAREAISLYFQPLLHPREALEDLLGKPRAENEQGSNRGTERR
ncbi:hypothetical protein IID22_00080 [Patescibacteria group bacterium]|nr:hypothetical protein [Patescibacteria group bacterium]